MADVSYGRVSDLSGLPDVILSHAGEEGLERALSRQSLSPEILEHPDAVIPMKDLIALYRNASEICAIRSIGLDAVQGLRPCDYGPMGSFVGQASTLRRAFLHKGHGAFDTFGAGYRRGELLATLHIIIEHVETGACGRQQDTVARLSH